MLRCWGWCLGGNGILNSCAEGQRREPNPSPPRSASGQMPPFGLPLRLGPYAPHSLDQQFPSYKEQPMTDPLALVSAVSRMFAAVEGDADSEENIEQRFNQAFHS